MEGVSQIAGFFKGKSVFITGATGFMGKVLVEKLLRSCNEVKSVYVLLRTKKGMDIESRLQKLFQVNIFDKIRADEPQQLGKVVAIEGDIALSDLGISEEDLKRILRDVSIVFHLAANVKFNEPLRSAVNFNVLGTRRVLQLCHKLTNIEVNKNIICFNIYCKTYCN